MALPDFETTLFDYTDWSTVNIERTDVKVQDKELRQTNRVKVLSNISVIIQPRSVNTTTTVIGRYTEMTHWVFCKIYDIRENDEIIKGLTRYLVLGVESYLSHHLEIAVKEIGK